MAVPIYSHKSAPQEVFFFIMIDKSADDPPNGKRPPSSMVICIKDAWPILKERIRFFLEGFDSETPPMVAGSTVLPCAVRINYLLGKNPVSGSAPFS